ncbi:HPP family [Neisseria animaloris]|uniref:HPP family n=2 Tax=Neisseria TaxID=482 RepID=A0A1X3CYY6_9NEIS|nr:MULTISPECIES: HPP family protein [Neisseria]OSI07189.1 HPP family protein [Neisseria animaloris]OSI12766.1 HPP family protein [Neisseria canis]VEE99994.1 HPP family [Neisseria canis]VEH86403.1 HPP family [Neisseria animaloris]
MVDKPRFQATENCPPRLPWKTIGFAWLGAVLATAAFAGLGNTLVLPLVLGSFGASCLLVFAYPQSPFAQPRNVIGGHFVATLTGLILMGIFGSGWWSMALAVGTAIALMLILRVPHPPAGSNPLIVMLGGVGWDFLLTPTLLGSLILVAVALFYNNWGEGRRYPTYWF